MQKNTNLINVKKARFARGPLISSGLQITPKVKDNSAAVSVEAWLEHAPPRSEVRFCIDNCDETIVLCEQNHAATVLLIDPVHPGNENNTPCIYTAKVELILDGQVIDSVEVNFTCR